MEISSSVLLTRHQPVVAGEHDGKLARVPVLHREGDDAVRVDEHRYRVRDVVVAGDHDAGQVL